MPALRLNCWNILMRADGFTTSTGIRQTEKLYVRADLMKGILTDLWHTHH